MRPWLKVNGPAFSSVYQGAIRFNTYVGLAVALAVFNPEGGAVAALVMAIMIPSINVLCVLERTCTPVATPMKWRGLYAV